MNLTTFNTHIIQHMHIQASIQRSTQDFDLYPPLKEIKTRNKGMKLTFRVFFFGFEEKDGDGFSA